VQGEHADFMILTTIADHFASAGEENEVVGAVPLLDHVQALVDFVAEAFTVKVSAEEDGFDRPAEFGEGLVGRMLNVTLNEAAQDRFRFGRAETDGRHVFDHLVVLLTDQFPIDRLRQNELQVFVSVRVSRIRPGQLLNVDRLQPWHELETQDATSEDDGDLSCE
jgi:hypothetical protein